MAVYDQFPEFFERESALLGSARCYLMVGDGEMAYKLYTKFIEEYKNSPQLSDAQFALATITAQSM
jgi:hypothetical protein